MSTEQNDNLLDRAQQVMSYYEGTILEDAIRRNLGANDLDKALELVINAEAEMAREEYYAYDAY